MTSLRWYHLVFLTIALLLLVSCTNQQEKVAAPQDVSAATKPIPKMPQPITAAHALEQMQGYAQKQWASDALPIHIESEPNTEANGQDGKATVWKGVFGSMRRGEIRTFTWSGSLEANAPVKGVAGAASESAMTPELAAQMFQGFLIKADTDMAATIAGEHGGSTLLKKDPQQPVKYIVAFDSKANAPMVFVIYGESLKKNKGFGVIHAISGTYLRGGKSS